MLDPGHPYSPSGWPQAVAFLSVRRRRALLPRGADGSWRIVPRSSGNESTSGRYVDLALGLQLTRSSPTLAVVLSAFVKVARLRGRS